MAANTMRLKVAQRIGFVVSSMRSPRAGSQIANVVTHAINASRSTSNNGGSDSTLSLIDLQHWNFSLFDEPDIPVFIKDPSQYEHEHSRAWSAEVASYNAFIFVTPRAASLLTLAKPGWNNDVPEKDTQPHTSHNQAVNSHHAPPPVHVALYTIE